MNNFDPVTIISSVLLLLTIGSLYHIMTSRIKWLQKELSTSQEINGQLLDRLMAKNFDQYKMYEQIPNDTPPIIAEPEFDDSAVGTVSGQETFNDA